MSNHNKRQNHQNQQSGAPVESSTGNDAASNVNTEAQDTQGVAKQASNVKEDVASSNTATNASKKSPSQDFAQAGQQQQQGQSVQQGLGNISLSDILPEMNSENIANIGERILTYAEEKPLQTIGLATAAGALVGWLLTSKQGHSVLRTTASIATPFVNNLISGRQGGAQESAGANLKH